MQIQCNRWGHCDYFVSVNTMSSQCTCWVFDPLPPVSLLRYVAGTLTIFVANCTNSGGLGSLGDHPAPPSPHTR